jgi:hypothetical protein
MEAMEMTQKLMILNKKHENPGSVLRPKSGTKEEFFLTEKVRLHINNSKEKIVIPLHFNCGSSIQHDTSIDDCK